jgi:hypothetical protein
MLVLFTLAIPLEIAHQTEDCSFVTDLRFNSPHMLMLWYWTFSHIKHSSFRYQETILEAPNARINRAARIHPAYIAGSTMKKMLSPLRLNELLGFRRYRTPFLLDFR